MKNTFQIFVVATLAAFTIATPAFATPRLRSDVTVTSPIVTVGDMFENADMLAERPLFQSPNPGTSGRVSLAAVTQAAAKIGLDSFENIGVLAVEVRRQGTLIDEQLITDAIVENLERRGVVTQGISTEISFFTALPLRYADQTAEPLELVNLQYGTNDNQFKAFFNVAGATAPLTLSGRLNLFVQMPHLVSSQAAGEVIEASDVEMRDVQLRFAQASGMPELDQVIGKQLIRPARGGMMLRPSDLTEPQLIARNDAVTIFLRKGPLTLTVKGQALNDASYGQTVSVLNSLSNKVINGYAIEAGTVLIGDRPLANPTL
jgi:flagella basal body P-ring formation protein FlgA